ncbi:MAG: hypothetical protein KAR84_05855 [Elusimicrobiales bacterium]|nr:hypothetical protein [Elusimicrobiales bacterium]MCK5106838.1 hypothetical protein [Elusimicrobiales bacterium]
MGIWKNAFKLPKNKIVSEEEKKLLLKLSDKVKKRGLSDIIVLSIESSRPVHNLGAQSLIFLMPFITMIFKKEMAERFVKILENPDAVSFFIEQLTDDSSEKNRSKK